MNEIINCSSAELISLKVHIKFIIVTVQSYKASICTFINMYMFYEHVDILTWSVAI